MSLVAYGSSDEETESPDEGETNSLSDKKFNNNGNLENISVSSTIHNMLPEPQKAIEEIDEIEDEFLLKTATNLSNKALKNEKVKISIPSMNKLIDAENKLSFQQMKPSNLSNNKKSGLLSVLPKPSSAFSPATKPTIPTVSKIEPSTSSHTVVSNTKSVGLIPYALMNKNKKVNELKNKNSTKMNEDNTQSSDEEDSGTNSFFSFGDKDELPNVSEHEIHAMVAKETEKMNKLRNYTDSSNITEPMEIIDSLPSDSQNLDTQAIQALVGGNRAKRSKIDNIQILDLSANEVMPDRDEWMRRAVRGETEYVPTGNIVDKGPNSLAKRKHQISYLAFRAEKNEAELEAMWASNRQTKRESKSKYGF